MPRMPGRLRGRVPRSGPPGLPGPASEDCPHRRPQQPCCCQLLPSSPTALPGKERLDSVHLNWFEPSLAVALFPGGLYLGFCGERKGGRAASRKPQGPSATQRSAGYIGLWVRGEKKGWECSREEPRSKMLQDPPTAVLRLVLLTLLDRLVPPARATEAPELCEVEMNKIKDLLQVSCVEKGLAGLPAGLPTATGLLLLGSNRLGPRLSLAAFQPLAQLSELDLSNNSLSTLETGAPLPHLQQLALSHNALDSLPDFQGLPALTRLALGHNALTQLQEGAFRALGGLQDLQLQGNQLRRLPSGAFQGLQDLQDLDLSDNHLEALPWDLLAGLKALEILRLERNRLQTVPDGFFPEENTFVYVYLAENPWSCNCRLAYLQAWILDHDYSIYTRVQVAEKEVTENDPQSVKCQAPPKEKGRPVMLFKTACRKLGDSDGGEGEKEESPQSTHSTPLPPFLHSSGAHHDINHTSNHSLHTPPEHSHDCHSGHNCPHNSLPGPNCPQAHHHHGFPYILTQYTSSSHNRSHTCAQHHCSDHARSHSSFHCPFGTCLQNYASYTLLSGSHNHTLHHFHAPNSRTTSSHNSKGSLNSEPHCHLQVINHMWGHPTGHLGSCLCRPLYHVALS
ncbi:platelet glycoprotein Ib alpha chain [Sceloporus undulatus]|uniref:platelet glycoprotein Ib alpha chain n=1 Tax=Sceloporus undulatus TaxID=8520 RepID=UPI001C4AD4BE|nr:platelet glycoprotein Ib alpha chain [Sceloporus undulatus]